MEQGGGGVSGPADPPPPLQILYARDVDQRSTTFEKSLLMGKEFQRRAKAMILRAAVLRNQIHVKVRVGPGDGGGTAGHTHTWANGLVSPAVPSPGREPGGADAGQQPVPDEHQHVSVLAWRLQEHLHALPPGADTWPPCSQHFWRSCWLPAVGSLPGRLCDPLCPPHGGGCLKGKASGPALTCGAAGRCEP